ncbi:MAG: endopeptidase La [Bacteroidota bacterium]
MTNEDLDPNDLLLDDDEVVIEQNDTGLSIAENNLPRNLSIVPLIQRPIFPGMVLPMTFTGEDKLAVLQDAIDHNDGYIGAVLTLEYDEEDFSQSDFVDIGTAYRIRKVMPIGPEAVQVIGEAVRRFRRRKQLSQQEFLRWEVDYYQRPKTKPDNELRAYMLAISKDVKELLQLNPLFQEQVNMVVSQLNYDQPGRTMDIISNLLSSEKSRLQELLETWEPSERAKILLAVIKDELEVAKIQHRINKKIESDVNQQQKEFFLREQLKAIKRELGEEQEEGESIEGRILSQLEGKELPAEAQKAFDREMNKLRTLNNQSPEFNITRTYLETFAGLPWNIYSPDNQNVPEARRILDSDHYGLGDVKDSILEFLATILKRDSVAGNIICMVGPPGVGKTSIGKSIAKALGREFFRFSVGGMRDEAEIKGHRRTYIGAMPGKLIQALQRVGTSNPVVMLDEIDKIGSSFRGDPASALLEVLDPEQNDSFMDHYLDVPFDLSNVLFVTTANQLDTIPGPLLDRMEVIRLSGYVQAEKIEIAKQYLIPKQLREHNFAEEEVSFTEEALSFLTDSYAREAGVRNLEKQLRKIIRKLVLRQAEGQGATFEVDRPMVEELLGKPPFKPEKLYDRAIAGVVLGLAYTSMGGATLYIEATGIPHAGGGFKQTGQLGDVMKESALIAYSYVRSLLSKEGLDYFDSHQIHLHVPAGATPKDGPSAGITMALALYGLATNQAPLFNLAMTGELTLTGRVLPIGGVKEKTIGAKRVGIKTLIFPKENQRDFEELPDYIKEGIDAHFAEYFDDVLKVAYPDRIPPST